MSFEHKEIRKEKIPEFESINLTSQEYDERFENAPLYEKFAIVHAHSAEEGEKITTIVNGFEETTATTRKGDFVITNPGGEEYVIPCEEFEDLYEPLGDGQYKSVGKVGAFVTEKDVCFLAPWGELMKIKAGGYLVDNGNKRYGIAKEAFHQTYRLVGEG